MFSDCRKMMIDSSANGSVSGSDSRIVIGCSHDSNCAARIRYMKTSDSTNASTKFCAARPSSLDRPAKRAAVLAARRSACRTRPASRSAPSACDAPGSRLAEDRHLPLPRRGG